jgi:hypothetical protein
MKNTQLFKNGMFVHDKYSASSKMECFGMINTQLLQKWNGCA